MTNIPKKLNNNVGVKLSSTLAGQRELIREMRNKINELIDYLQAKEEANKCQCRCHSGAGNFSCVECESKHDMRDLYKQPEEASKEQYIYTCSCSAVYDPELKNCPACGEKTIYNGKYLCYTCNQWGIVGEHKCEASKGECKEYRLSDCIACGKQYLVPKNVMAGAFCDECRKNNPPEQEEREQWQCDLAILMGKMVGPRKATFDDLLENFIKERFVSKEKIKRAIEDAADCAPGTRGRTLDAISKSLGLGD